MNPRIAQLAVGWLALCGLTAGGTYYGMLELDQQYPVQAKLQSWLGPATAPPAANPAAPPPGPGTVPANPNPDPRTVPDPVVQPVVTPDPKTGTKPANPPPGQTPPPPSQTPVTTLPPVTQPVVTQPVVTPTPPVTVVQPPVSRPSPSVAGVQVRYDDLVDRGNQIVTFFHNMEDQLKAAGQPLRATIKSAMRAVTIGLQDAQGALRRGDGLAAAQALDAVEQKIVFLEQSK